MQKYTFSLLVLSLLALPAFASAHERQLFNIGGTDYLFVVGSLGEPVVVDDKSGVDLRVQVADPRDPTNSSAGGVKPVLGLESALKVEISAGDKKKMFDLTTVYGTPGSYKAIFFPTVQTTLTYRFTGTINDTPIDLAFTCAAEGTKAVEDKSVANISDGVTRTYKNGQFGCPLGKEGLGFPEEGMTLIGFHGDVHEHMEALEAGARNGNTASMALGVLGVLLAAVALWRGYKKGA